VSGADRRLIKRLDVLIGGRRVARDQVAPFSAMVRRAGRVKVVVVLRDGRRVQAVRPLRGCGPTRAS
jgi:hypothetical protein